jgi:hypothetical protein
MVFTNQRIAFGPSALKLFCVNLFFLADFSKNEWGIDHKEEAVLS